MLFDRERGLKSLKKFYLTHTTNISIKMAQFLPGVKANEKILRDVNHYLTEVKNENIHNSIFFKLLVSKLSYLTQKVINNYHEELNHNLNAHNPKEELSKILLMMSDLTSLLTSMKNKTLELHSTSIEVAKNLILILSTGIY
jgi:hypothetical protein